jgi:hypothetical protein
MKRFALTSALVAMTTLAAYEAKAQDVAYDCQLSQQQDVSFVLDATHPWFDTTLDAVNINLHCALLTGDPIVCSIEDLTSNLTSFSYSREGHLAASFTKDPHLDLTYNLSCERR